MNSRLLKPVHFTDMECLGLLFHKKIASPSELSAHTGLSSGSTTAMLDRLEKAGIIKRQHNPEDRRGVLITVVKEEAVKIAPLFTSTRNAQNTLLSNYSEKELEFLADFLSKFVTMMDHEREKLQKTIDKMEDVKGGDNK